MAGLTRLCWAVTLALMLAGPAWAQGRVALVVGAGAYRSVPALPNPPRDARAMAGALREAGFQVDLVLDPDRGALEGAIRRFGAVARRADVAVFFYAGHALEFGGANYLVPVTARIENGRDVPFEALNLDLLGSQVEGARTTLIFLDACRDNPMAVRLGGGERGIGGRGLAAPDAAPTGTLIAYATAPGHTAADGAGEHSPFTGALLREIGARGLEVRQLLSRVRKDVREATGGQQVPWESSALEGEFYFYPAAAGAPAVPPPVAAAPPAPAPVAPTGMRSPPPPAPMPTPAPTAAPRAFCPPAGTLAELDNGRNTAYLGTDPSSDAMCLVGRLKRVFGIWAAERMTDGKYEAAMRTIVAGRQGTTVEIDRGDLHATFTNEGDEALPVGGETRRALHFSVREHPIVGSAFDARFHFWIDRADGVVLKRHYEYLGGNKQSSEDFSVVRVIRPR